MKAGASSMWASCCGLLNEVMGTGAVRGQQTGFGTGAGPFRFAPSAGYSTYPPASSGSPSLVCKACGQAFSVFRRKYMCCDCKKSFCSLCSVLQENLRRCATCDLLRATAFQRPLLMRLRVKDLRQYLMLRNIPTDTCREKEDLVDLVLCHQGAESDDERDHRHEEEEEEEEEEEPDTPTLQTRPLYEPPPTPPQQQRPPTPPLLPPPTLPPAVLEPVSPPSPAPAPAPASLPPPLPLPLPLPVPALAPALITPIPVPPTTTSSSSSSSQIAPLNPPTQGGEAISRSNSSGSTNQDLGDATSLSLLNLDPCDHTPEVSPQTRRRARASLSDLSSLEDVERLTVRQLKEILVRNFVSFSGCCEKWELVERVRRLYRENEENRKSMENVNHAITADGGPGQLVTDENLCRICMDAVIDCVLLECGHMVTCTKCGKRMSECPICRQFVVRAVHVFKS
ncbi:E3 ubiquitin-protein ligase RNF34a isoform X2 [Engraulis encrasicolus]|uniref:E3 ubiquitin-protein ligase RNF34a isoform X2 n=1 Tax=Engraulis encrasicolus TaxID=184585 RepID=UPI002FD25829